MISQHEAEMKELNDILYTMELRHRERETEADHEFQGMMDELKNKVSTRLIKAGPTLFNKTQTYSGIPLNLDTFRPRRDDPASEVSLFSGLETWHNTSTVTHGISCT